MRVGFGAGGARESLLLFGAALALYVLFAQSSFYRNDAPQFVRMLIGDWYQHDYHALYPHFLQATKWLTAPLGLSPFAIATFASALGTALGVLFLHRAALHTDSARAGWIAASCALTPAVFFFATVVEVHGPFFASVGLAWLAAVRWERQPSAVAAIATGAACGLAAGMHGTGQLLPLPLVCWVWPAWRGRGWRAYAEVGALVATHAACGLTVQAWQRAQGLGTAGQLGRFLELAAQADRFGLVVDTLWFEWLLAFAPFSFCCLVAMRDGGERRRAAAFQVAVAIYVLAAFFVLQAPRERGAYLVPLVFPAVVLTVRHGSARLVALCAAGAAGLAVGQVMEHDREPEGVAFVADMRAALGTRPAFVFLGERLEINGVLRDWPQLPTAQVHELLLRDVPPQYDAVYAGKFDEFVEASWARGEQVYMTETAQHALAWEPNSAHGRLLRQHIAVRYRLTPVRHGAFRAVRLERGA